MKLRKVYIPSLVEGKRFWPILIPNLGMQREKESRLFRERIPELFNEKIVDVVQSIEDAEFLLLPYDIISYSQEELEKHIHTAREHKLLVVGYQLGDYSRKINIPDDVVIFRTSTYKEALKPNEIITPPFLEDLLSNRRFVLREKKEQPVVGFCGWGNFESISKHIKSKIKNTLFQTYARIKRFRHWRAHTNGVLLRKKVLSMLDKSPSVETNFIIRNSFSRNSDTIELSPEQARKEYIENLENSDLCVVVRGDGNFSVRFFEILSMGRIPLFVDTDTPLPLEGVIDYDDFICRISYRDIKKIGKKVDAFWNSLGAEEFKNKQKQARHIFEAYLGADKFYRYAFAHLEELIKQFKRWEK